MVPTALNDFPALLHYTGLTAKSSSQTSPFIPKRSISRVWLPDHLQWIFAPYYATFTITSLNWLHGDYHSNWNNQIRSALHIIIWSSPSLCKVHYMRRLN